MHPKHNPTARKILTASESRYNGGAAHKRVHGSATITRFWVWYADSECDHARTYEGYGATPGERASHAKARFLADIQRGVLNHNGIRFEHWVYLTGLIPGVTHPSGDAIWQVARDAWLEGMNPKLFLRSTEHHASREVTRYIVYAKSRGKTPEEMLANDRIEYPGGCMAGFLVWSGQRIEEFRKLNPKAFIGGHIADHDAYDKWLANAWGRR